jgi:histidinol-phosphate aminotransferase
MFKIEAVIRPHILKLEPYSTARDDFKGEAEIFLDANENPHGSVVHGPFSRYPDPHQKRLKAALANIKGVSSEQVFISHGSDEGIELLIRACCEPERESILVMPPTYSMYQVSAKINNVNVIEVPLTENFNIDTTAVLKAITGTLKIIFICSPNNPSGSVQSIESIEALCQKFSGLIVVDEAYIDFCPEKSVLPLINKYKNLCVLQTFSKAWGLSALRIGALYADKEIVAVLSKIKPPYNISGITQDLAINAIRQKDRKDIFVKQIIESRVSLIQELKKLSLVKSIESSDANFILVRFADPVNIYQELTKRGIIVRDRSAQKHCQGALRITVGTPYENSLLVKALREIGKEAATEPLGTANRRALVKRKTNETSIVIDLNLDGSGETYISTGIGFLDHMLNQLGKHSGINLSVSVQGDLDIDEHHTVEDVGIAIGEALKIALGDKAGIARYGFTAPMDEARSSVSLDFSGRAYLVWQAEFKRESVGDLPTELFKHFFHSLADAAKLTLHISSEGENEHHKIEVIFKAFAQALKLAITRSANNTVPSTKGVL